MHVYPLVAGGCGFMPSGASRVAGGAPALLGVPGAFAAKFNDAILAAIWGPEFPEGRLFPAGAGAVGSGG